MLILCLKHNFNFKQNKILFKVQNLYYSFQITILIIIKGLKELQKIFNIVYISWILYMTFFLYNMHDDLSLLPWAVGYYMCTSVIFISVIYFMGLIVGPSYTSQKIADNPISILFEGHNSGRGALQQIGPRYISYRDGISVIITKMICKNIISRLEKKIIDRIQF